MRQGGLEFPSEIRSDRSIDGLRGEFLVGWEFDLRGEGVGTDRVWVVVVSI